MRERNIIIEKEEIKKYYQDHKDLLVETAFILCNGTKIT